MKILGILFFIVFSQAMAGDIEYAGKYIRYEGGEYESAFIPCSRDEVWWLEGGDAFLEGGDAFNDLLSLVYEIR